MTRWSVLVLALVCLFAAPLPAARAGSTDEDSDAAAVAAHLGISVSEAQRRLSERPGLDPVIAYVKSHRADFGGIYLDADAALAIALPAGRLEGRASLAGLIPPHADVRWSTVEYSLSDLDKVRDTLIARSARFDVGGSPVASLSINAARNVVVITLDGPIDEARAELVQEFGTAVVVESGPRATPEACTSRYICYPWRGGIYIYSSGSACTYGYNTHSDTGTALRMLTAGHCGNYTWYHNNGLIGTTSLNNLGSPGHGLGDFQRVPTSMSTPRNLIYASDTNMGRSITSIRTYRNQLQGDYVCKSGVATGYRCGLILDDDFLYSVFYQGQWVDVWGKKADYVADIGDSGGPVFINNTALGIHGGAVPGGVAYGTVDNAEIALAIRICLNSSCS